MVYYFRDCDAFENCNFDEIIIIFIIIIIIIIIICKIPSNASFELKRDERGDWRRLHLEEIHSLYPSPNIVKIIESRRYRWKRNRGR